MNADCGYIGAKFNGQKDDLQFFYGTSHRYELHRNQIPKYTHHTNLEKHKSKLHTMRLEGHDLSGYQRCA
jgi:hypothetical protein